MLALPFFQVDAFTDRPFAGNPAAVCVLEAPLDATVMQAIAAENNLSETAFVVRNGDAFDLRWFTPTVEVELCGHATLAAAFVLLEEIGPIRAEITFFTRSGRLTVRRVEPGRLVMSFPVQPPARADDATAARAAQMLGATPVEVHLGPTGTWLAVLPDAAAVERARPDLALVAAAGASLCITAAVAPSGSGGIDFVCRYFAPAHGIPEDPVTGSSFCLLAPYWSPRLGKTALRARQVSRRGGDVTCELAGDRVLIGGQACLVIKGILRA